MIRKKLWKWQVGSSDGCLSVNVSFILSGYNCQHLNRVHSATCKWTMSPLLCLSFIAYHHWRLEGLNLANNQPCGWF